MRWRFECLSLERIISVTLLENVASWRVMEKIGMAHRGTIRWRNSNVWCATGRRNRLDVAYQT